MQAYWLSKRTVVYLLEATQHAHGRTLSSNAGSQVDAGAVLGVSQTGLVADSRGQTAFTLGLRHAF